MPGSHLQEMVHETQAELTIAPQVHDGTGDLTGSDVDTDGFESITFQLVQGTFTGGTHAWALQSAPDDGSGSPGTYADIDSDDLVFGSPSDPNSETTPAAVQAVTGAEDDSCQLVGYIGSDRHVRVVLESTGAGDVAVAAKVLLGHARHIGEPVGSDGAIEAVNP